jgi:hypothetical protein
VLGTSPEKLVNNLGMGAQDYASLTRTQLNALFHSMPQRAMRMYSNTKKSVTARGQHPNHLALLSLPRVGSQPRLSRVACF